MRGCIIFISSAFSKFSVFLFIKKILSILPQHEKGILAQICFLKRVINAVIQDCERWGMQIICSWVKYFSIHSLFPSSLQLCALCLSHFSAATGAHIVLFSRRGKMIEEELSYHTHFNHRLCIPMHVSTYTHPVYLTFTMQRQPLREQLRWLYRAKKGWNNDSCLWLYWTT